MSPQSEAASGEAAAAPPNCPFANPNGPQPSGPEGEGRLAPVRGGSQFAGVPQNAYDTYDFVKEHNWTPPPGYKGGSVYRNSTGALPPGGNYREFDINPKIQGQNREPERIVVDINTGRSWYTSNHYGDVNDGNPPFIPMN